MALVGAELVLQVLESDVPADEQLLALEELRSQHLDPFIDEAWALDERLLEVMRHELHGGPAPISPPYPTPEEAYPWVRVDRDLWERHQRKEHLLAHPSTLFEGSDLGERILAARATVVDPPASTDLNREECLDAARDALAGLPS